jgi:hypothetical protein
MSQNKSTIHQKKKSVLVIKGQMMMLETLLDVKLAMLYSKVGRANLPLHITHTP